MGVVCNACGTEYVFDLSTVSTERTLRFRCHACRHRFSLSPERLKALKAAMYQEPPETQDIPSGLLLRRGEHVFLVKDLATLQRWIVQRRVYPTDLLSIGDGRWEPVNERSELRLFFELLNQANGREIVVPGMTDIGFEPPSEEASIITRNVLDSITEEIPLSRPITTEGLGPPAFTFSQEPTEDATGAGPLPITTASAPHEDDETEGSLDNEPELTPIEVPKPLSIDLNADLSPPMSEEEAFFRQETVEDLELDAAEPHDRLKRRRERRVRRWPGRGAVQRRTEERAAAVAAGQTF